MSNAALITVLFFTSLTALASPFNTVKIYTTAKDTNDRIRLTHTLTLSDYGQPSEKEPCIFVDATKTFQRFLGIGGALTDASAETFFKLAKDKQDQFMKSYYDPNEGIGYTLARTHINSCDFSSSTYSYVADNDSELKSFNISKDEVYRIPFIKQAIEAAGGRLTLFASPWSPPAWMKTNHDMLHGGKVKQEFLSTWASYYVKFIQAYEKAGIPIWGVTVQNEPMAVQSWESCNYTADEERDFIKKYLGPEFDRSHLSDKKIIAWDHNRDLIYHRASTILSDPDAAKYVWGLGFHWYESWTGQGQLYDNVKKVAESFPHTHLLFTEATVERFNPDTINSWEWGESYARSMISDFNNGTEGWTDWNILLDEKGGPNHVGNFCFAPVHADTKSGALTFLSSYYYIGHFSKFIRPGAKRISSVSSRGHLLSTAFLNEDGKIAAVVMNQGSEKMSYLLWIASKAAAIIIPPHSIQTLVVESL